MYRKRGDWMQDLGYSTGWLEMGTIAVPVLQSALPKKKLPMLQLVWLGFWRFVGGLEKIQHYLFKVYQLIESNVYLFAVGCNPTGQCPALRNGGLGFIE